MFLQSWETTPRWCLPAGRNKRILASPLASTRSLGKPLIIEASSHLGMKWMGQCWMFPPEAHTSANSLSCQVYCVLNFNHWHIYASHTRRLRLQTGVTFQWKARQRAQLWPITPAAARTTNGEDSCPLNQTGTCALSSHSALKYSASQ